MEKQIFFLALLLMGTMLRANTKQDSVARKHKVLQNETPASISQKYKITKDQLMTWNHLSNSMLRPGDSLIVGYKKTSAHNKNIKPAANTSAQKQNSKTVSDTAKPKEYKAKEIIEGGLGAYVEEAAKGLKNYQAYHNKAPVGTVIKVTNTVNKEVVYVQVVGFIPEAVQGNAVIVISKMAADKLHVSDNMFVCKLSYAKE